MGNWLMDCGEFQCVVTSALPAIAHLPEVKLQLSHTHTHTPEHVCYGATHLSTHAVFRCRFASLFDRRVRQYDRYANI